MPNSKPNILLLMSDQHRGDFMGCAGNSVIKTPNLDSIAKTGATFLSAYASAPSCTPARTGLLTGLSPWHHGMLGYGRVASSYPVELPKALNQAGYYTFGIGKMHWFPQKSLHGFYATLVDESSRIETPSFISDYRKWFKEKNSNLDPDATGIGFNDCRSRPYALPEELHPTSWTAQSAIDFIESYNDSRPFMLKVSFARPHSPYDPPKRFMDMYNEKDMQKPYIGDWCSEYAAIQTAGGPFNVLCGDLGETQIQQSRRGYYGSISFIDEQIGRVLDTLKKRNMLDNTLVIYCSDHGDMLGDHHLWRKTYAYEGSAKIPMLLSWPKNFGYENVRGRVFNEIVELRDILPTFLDMAGSSIPAGLDGKSLLDIIRGNKSGWRSFIDLEHSTCYDNSRDWNALANNEFKYIYHAYWGREQLFDLKNDPAELHDLSVDPAEQKCLRQWRALMVEYLAERGQPFVRNGKLLLRKTSLLYGINYPGNDGGLS